MTDRMPIQQPSGDALVPADIAQRLEAANVRRAALPFRNLIVLGVLGGIYIGFGGALATLALTDSSLGFGLGRLAAGVAFSLGSSPATAFACTTLSGDGAARSSSCMATV